MKTYLCSWSKGSYDCYELILVFVTNDFKLAKSWAKKANLIIPKIAEHNKNRPYKKGISNFRDFNEATWEEIELR